MSQQSPKDTSFNLSSISADIKNYELQARESLSRPIVKSIPSRLLKKSDNTTIEGESKNYFTSTSTINDSDLFPDCSSTPRCSVSTNSQQVRDRQSIGPSITRLSQELASTNDVMKYFKDIQETMRMSNLDCCFQSSKTTEERFAADEASWSRKYKIPTQFENELSIDLDNGKLSMSTFFTKRCENISMFKKSPEKDGFLKPQPLIDTTNTTSIGGTNVPEPSLSLSTIANMLSDTSETPTKTLNKLLQKGVEKPQVVEFDSSPDVSFTESLKENLNIIEKTPIDDKACTRSSSVLSHLPNGKLPIATTHCELNYGCVKLGKQVNQDFTIRNKTNSRLWIKCHIPNLAFKVRQDRTENPATNELKIILHPFETRKVIVTFAPVSEGAIAENLYFNSIDTHHQQTEKQYVRLRGYGGFGVVSFTKINKDTSGKLLLSLGMLENGERKRTFTIKSTGTLSTFVLLEYVSRNLNTFNSVSIYPPALILQPNEEHEVIVSYTPKKDEYQYIKNKMNSLVVDVGIISIIYGTEVDRARIKKISKHFKSQGGVIPEKAKKLMEPIPGEEIIKDIHKLRESSNSLSHILQLLDYNEVILTVEREDVSDFGLYHDDTMFQSLCAFNGDGNQTVRRDISVEPSVIFLTPPFKLEDLIILSSASRKAFSYQAYPSAGLGLKPASGRVQEGEKALIRVSYLEEVKLSNEPYKIEVVVDGDMFEVDVKIMQIN